MAPFNFCKLAPIAVCTQNSQVGSNLCLHARWLASDISSFFFVELQLSQLFQLRIPRLPSLSDRCCDNIVTKHVASSTQRKPSFTPESNCRKLVIYLPSCTRRQHCHQTTLQLPKTGNLAKATNLPNNLPKTSKQPCNSLAKTTNQHMINMTT